MTSRAARCMVALGVAAAAVVSSAGFGTALVSAGALARQGSAPLLSQLVWFDRNGNRLGTVGPIGNHGNVELSPDGRQVAVAVRDTATATRDLWIYDVQDGRRTRFTSTPGDENWAVWSRDGRSLIFNSTSADGRLSLFQAELGQGRAPLLLLRDGMWPVSLAPDGRHLLFVVNIPDTRDGPGTANDVMVLPLFGDREPYPFARTEQRLRAGPPPVPTFPISENWAAFSPNGRWVAFSSTESGLSEVYVAPFPPTAAGLAGKQRVSVNGGSQARWSRDGREIFYIGQDRTLMVTAVNGEGGTFQVGEMTRLFEPRFFFLDSHGFDIAPDGRRILVNTLVVSPNAPSSIARGTIGPVSPHSSWQ